MLPHMFICFIFDENIFRKSMRLDPRKLKVFNNMLPSEDGTGGLLRNNKLFKQIFNSYRSM